MATLTTHYGFDKPALGENPWGALRNTNMDDLDAELAKPRIIQSALTWGATTTVDLSLARVFTGTNTAISTIAFSNVPASFPNGAVVPVVRVLLILTNGGANAITWPASVSWLSGAAPTLRASGVDVVELVTRDGGTTWHARSLAARRVVGSVNTDTGTGAATAETVLHTVTVPAGIMGAKGVLRVLVCYDATVVNGNKTVRVRFGGAAGDVIYSAVHAGADVTSRGIIELFIANRGATNSQLVRGIAIATTSSDMLAVPNAATSRDTTVAQDIVFTGETADALDEITAKLMLVELLAP